MARIPVYERRVQQDGGAPIARVSGADPIGAAMQNLGQAGERAAGLAMQMDLQAQERALREQDKARRDAEELDKAQVPNLLSNGQVYWQQREDERRQAWKVGDPDMREKAGQEFDKWVAESSKALNTDDGRRYFQQHAASMRARLLTDTYSYQRRSTVEKLNADNAVGEANDEILVARAWNNPAEVNAIITRRIEPLLARTDLSEAEKIVAAEKVKARMFLARERAFVENDPQGWLLANGGLPKPGTAPAGGQPVSIDTLFAAVVGQESGGVHTKPDGSLLTSPKGARGISQVMPRTGEDPGYGVAPLSNQSREEYLRFGRDYLQAMLREFGGDQAKALAAYNAGPGAVQDAVKARGSGWLSAMPQETKDYVASITSKVGGAPGPASGAAAGAPAAPTGWASQHLDPDKLYQLRNLAESRVAQVQTQVRGEAERVVGDALAMHKDGKVDPFNLTPDYFNRAFGADGPRRFTEYKAGQGMAQAIGNFASQSPEQIAAVIQAAAPAQGPGYAMADARQQVMVQAARQVIEERAKDPQAFAMRHGLASTRPLDMNQPATMAPELAKRQATAAAMRDRYSTPLRVFTVAEAQQLSQVLAAFPTEGKIAYLDQLRRGLTDPQTFRAAMAQIAPDSPVTAVAATILTAMDNVVMPGGMFSDNTVLQPRKVAATMLEGEAILNPTRGAKAQDGRGGKFPMPKEADLELAFTQAVGKAFRNDAAGFGTAYQAFKAYYAGAASQRGVLSEQIDNKLAKEAIAAATGGVIDFNGAGEVLKPWGTSDDQFKNEIAAEFNRLIEVVGYKGTSLDNLRAYGLLGLGQGRYAVVNGSDALRAPTGQAIILTLQARSTAQIPGAR
jgi:hypothetical protein